jgi:hypothetical protein
MANDILSSFLGGQQAGQQQRTRRTLAEFLQPALGGDQNALSQVYAADPDAGLQVQGMVQKQQTADREQQIADLKQAATLYPSAPDAIKAQLYGRIVDGVEGLGLAQAGSLPRQHNPEFDAGFNQFLSAIAGTPQDQGYTLSPGSKRFDAQNRMVAEVPFAPASMTPIQTDQGYAAFNPKTGTASPLNYGGQGEAAPAIDQSAVQRNLAMLGASPGVQMTSGLRTPERNAAVGGKPNSQHLRGTAGDYVVPQAQKADFMRQVESAGLQAIDEGDHVHVQQPRGGSRVMPAQKAGGPSDFERKVEMARSMGATPDQLKQMVIGESGGGKPSATQIKLANTAKQKLIDLKAMEDQLGKVEAAFKPLKGSFSAGPGGGYLPTVEGKQFDAAVALLKGMARKLTRTPGEGAMSDYESKLAELANPSRSEYEDVTADQIQQLRALVHTTREGYEALLQDAGGSSGNLPGGKSGGGDIDSILSKYGVR